MSLVYWFIVLGALDNALLGICIALGIIALFFTITFFCNFDPDDEDHCKGLPFFKKCAVICWIVCIIAMLGTIFIPSKNEMYAIYGIGTVIDYANQSEELKETPDKLIKLTNTYIDTIQRELETGKNCQENE